MLRLVFLAALAAGFPFHLLDDTELPVLQFRRDGTFGITVFSDTHMGETDSPPEDVAEPIPQDAQTLRVMGDVLDHEQPDFVVLNGDLISGEYADSLDPDLTRHIGQLVLPMVRRGLSWGSTYGEHDHRCAIDGSSIRHAERMFRGARTKNMSGFLAKFRGTTNYYLPVYAATCPHPKRLNCHPELILWFFDSRGGYQHGKKTNRDTDLNWQSWVHRDMAKWFIGKSRELNKAAGREIPSLVFVHIPITAARRFQERGIDPHKNPGINDDVPVDQQGRKWCDSRVHDQSGLGCYSSVSDERFMTALATVPNILGLFFGHDHGNSWCGTWRPGFPGTTPRALNLCYGQRTGYGGYGHWIRGGRQIIVERRPGNFSVRTHIRLEDGTVVGAVHLNSTFGRDVYPATPNNKTYYPAPPSDEVLSHSV